MVSVTAPEQYESVQRLKRDVLDAAVDLSDGEARFLVDAYYTMQDNRKRSNQQAAALDAAGEPNRVIAWIAVQDEILENQIKRALDRYSLAQPLGVWMRSHVGIGPVIAAGFLAHVSFDGLTSVGKLWRFAGLDPTVRWEKGKKRPWNAELKTLCWKLGDSFCKFSNHPECNYGHLYRARKLQEVERNEAGLFAEQAARTLETKNFRDDTVSKGIYAQGKLPPAHLDQRARRVAVKMFLSHMFEVGYELKHGEKPGLPYAIAQLQHVDYIAPFNWPMDVKNVFRTEE